MSSDARVFYVYVLFDWRGIPRYVGKGKGNRWLDHERKSDPKNRPRKMRSYEHPVY